MISFAIKVFVWCSLTCLVFFFFAIAFVIKPEKLLPRPMSRTLAYIFSSRNFIVSGLNMQAFNPFWVGLCVWCQMLAEFHYCACGCPAFQHHLLQRLFLTSYMFLAPLWWVDWLYMRYMCVFNLWTLYSIPYLFLRQCHTALISVAL